MVEIEKNGEVRCVKERYLQNFLSKNPLVVVEGSFAPV